MTISRSVDIFYIWEKQQKQRRSRVGNIGEIYQDDIDKVAGLLSDFLDSKRNLQAKGA